MSQNRYQQNRQYQQNAYRGQQNNGYQHSFNPRQAQRDELIRTRRTLVLQQEEVLAQLKRLDADWMSWRQATEQLYRSRPSAISQVALPVLANVLHMRSVLPALQNESRAWYQRYQNLSAIDLRLQARSHQLNAELETIVNKLTMIEAELIDIDLF